MLFVNMEHLTQVLLETSVLRFYKIKLIPLFGYGKTVSRLQSH